MKFELSDMYNAFHIDSAFKAQIIDSYYHLKYIYKITHRKLASLSY